MRAAKSIKDGAGAGFKYTGEKDIGETNQGNHSGGKTRTKTGSKNNNTGNELQQNRTVNINYSS